MPNKDLELLLSEIESKYVDAKNELDEFRKRAVNYEECAEDDYLSLLFNDAKDHRQFESMGDRVWILERLLEIQNNYSRTKDLGEIKKSIDDLMHDIRRIKSDSDEVVLTEGKLKETVADALDILSSIK